MGSDQQFCLRWHNYQSSLLASLPQFLDSDNLTDVTLSAGGRSIRAHKVVLSACSQYFNELFKVLHPTQHPVVIIPGTTFPDLCALVTFMYNGEVNIYQDQLQGLLNMADAMQIRGLAEVSGSGQNIRSRKDCSNSAKRQKMYTQTTQEMGGINLEKRSEKCNAQPLQTESVAINSQHNKGMFDFDINSGLVKSVGAHLKIDSLSQHGNLKRHNTINSQKTVKNCESHANDDNSTINAKTVPPDDTDYAEDDIDILPTTKSSPKSDQEQIAHIKTENEIDLAVYSSSIEPLDIAKYQNRFSVRNTNESSCLEKTLSTPREMSGQQSPPSDDSNGVNFITDKKHQNWNMPLTSLKLEATSGHFSKFYLPNPTASNNSKLYATCFVCGKQLSNQYNLRVHLETHQNVNYACSVCSHISRSRDALRKHISYRHPGEARDKVALGATTKETRFSLGTTSTVSSKKVKVNPDNDDNKQVS